MATFAPKYPVVQPNPTFLETTKNIRDSDILKGGAVAAVSMGFLFYPTSIRSVIPANRPAVIALSTFLCAVGGFSVAYFESSFRLMGLKLNDLEVAQHGVYNAAAERMK
ncbi:hypothetical protein H696_02592 [Fonticula alba]|uniref:NADH-ubiquinone oxidoreductase 21kDa subunit N-terminal domain-containing protein n=1 Tax=Fonticula alba TaxID=691883 RepID=A0A058Z9Q0_FONAL|nr:hypothetical protein H696_02592 [Fonticula alba]KCV70262.1 hypothetical protein H696_02592 [Fonticula alba]|eukprot:XP_009494778.1 hypothetical protein H696_02592 [Fonticula alba]